jgi:hypothetical protein
MRDPRPRIRARECYCLSAMGFALTLECKSHARYRVIVFPSIDSVMPRFRPENGVNRPICAHFGQAVSLRTSARILMRRLERRSRRRRG